MNKEQKEAFTAGRGSKSMTALCAIIAEGFTDENGKLNTESYMEMMRRICEEVENE